MRKHTAKILFGLLSLLLALSMVLTACGGNGDTQETDPADTGKTTEADTQPGDVPTEPETQPTETPTDPESQPVETDPAGETDPAEETKPSGKGNPTITLSSTDDLTVKAGESIELPVAKATDYDGRDITSWMEIEDNADTNSIEGNTFTGRVAGDHTIYYFVETADERQAEAFLTIHVTGVHENTFDVGDADDATQMITFKPFRDGFEKGRKSPLYTGINGGGSGAYLSAGEEAIEGNSLVMDFTSNSSIHLMTFNDYYHRKVQTTYKVTFSYKIVEANGNFGDVYFGLSWDGYDGSNRQFIPADAELDKVYTFTAEFPSATVPEDVSAYFTIFKLRPAEQPLVIVFDNFIVETIKVEQVVPVIPTADELAEGFTWDFTKTAAVATNGVRAAVDSLPDDIKAAVSGNSAFSTNVLKLTNADDHSFSGLTAKNLVEGKILVVDIDYYAVNDQRFYLIMMGGGNPTQTIENTADGAFHHVHLETLIKSGWYQLNIYGQNNPQFEIYIGRITAKLVDADAPAEGTTPNGHEFGMTFEQNSRAFGNDFNNNGVSLAAYDGYDFGEYADRMGAATKITFNNAKDCVLEWFRAEGKIEKGYLYRITTTYYVDSFPNGEGAIQFCMDRAAFPFIGTGAFMSDGFHEETIEWVADRDVDFVCFYIDGSRDYNGTVYMKGVKVELVGKGE